MVVILVGLIVLLSLLSYDRFLKSCQLLAIVSPILLVSGFQSCSWCGFRPVDDYNEIASHFIECIYVHIYNSRLRVFI